MFDGYHGHQDPSQRKLRVARIEFQVISPVAKFIFLRMWTSELAVPSLENHNRSISSSRSRVSARPCHIAGSTPFRLAQIVQNHNTFVILDGTLSEHLPLLARTERSLLLLGLSLLLRPFLADGVFSRVLERVETGVVATTVAVEA